MCVCVCVFGVCDYQSQMAGTLVAKRWILVHFIPSGTRLYYGTVMVTEPSGIARGLQLAGGGHQAHPL